MTFVEPDCTIEFHGRRFTASGAVVTPDRLIAYLEAAPGRESVGRGITICTSRGEPLGQGLVTAVWRRPRSWLSSVMVQVTCSIDGIRYTGRAAGFGMLYRARATRPALTG